MATSCSITSTCVCIDNVYGHSVWCMGSIYAEMIIKAFSSALGSNLVNRLFIAVTVLNKKYGSSASYLSSFGGESILF